MGTSSASGVVPLAACPGAASPLPQRVLLIDDEAAIRQAVTGLLQAHGVTIDAVASEAEAEAVLVRNGVVKEGDLIVLTIGEPIGKSGGTNTMKIVKVGAPHG